MQVILPPMVSLSLDPRQASSLFTLIMDGLLSAALKNCATAFGLSDTGNSHQPSHCGVSGSARNVGTCGLTMTAFNPTRGGSKYQTTQVSTHGCPPHP